MAKYVGKIFKVDNKKLGLRESKTHFVYVQWYDQKKKNFRCRVISSFEREMTFEKNDPKKKILSTTPFYKVSNNSFCIFKKQDYGKLRDGEIEPIPMKDLKNATHWYGFTKTVTLDRKDLKMENKKMKYNKNGRV